MEELQDIKITGDGQISQGNYRNVKVMGNVTLLGDINAEKIKIMGAISCEGNIKAKEFVTSGGAVCNGKINVTEIIKVSGGAEFKEDISSNEIKIHGGAEFSGSVKFNKMFVSGGCEIKGDCEGEDFFSSGYIEVKELLSADKVTILPSKNSYVKEIGGSEIHVVREKIKKVMFINVRMKSDGYLNSDVIEGDKIFLENTNCKIVRGHDITIGVGCNIEKIEYTGELKVNDKSTVGEKICMKN